MRKRRNFWNKENCMQVSLKYKTRSEFKLNEPSAYISARKKGFLNEICAHMIKIGNKKKRCIYSYEFEDNWVYVGLTGNPEMRKIWRENNDNDSVTKHIQKTGLNPKYIQLTDFVDINEASKLEGLFLKKYKEDGWNILNITKTGGIGGGDLYWTKERCENEVLKYSTRNEFRMNSRSAYNSSLRNNWLNDIYKHTEKSKRKIKWTFEACRDEASKYQTKKEFAHKAGSAYHVSLKNKWINQICAHMHKLPYNTVKWTKERCQLAANECETKTEFFKNYSGAYYRSLKNNWLNEFYK